MIRLLVSLAVFIAAYGAHATTVQIQVESDRFDADNNNATHIDTVTITEGDTVEWVWVAGFHTVTNGASPDPADNPGSLFDADVNSASPSFSFTFNTAGTYPYFCRFHVTFSNMRGIIVVNPATGEVDADHDGMDDAWELQYGLDPFNPDDAALDLDDDLLDNLGEFAAGTDPTLPDTDGDAYWDAIELELGSDPLLSTSIPEGSGLTGDINLDGLLDANDVQLVINGALLLPVPFRCDTDGNLSIDAADVQRVINAVLAGP